MADDTTFTKLTIPAQDPHNVQATKYYIFNETGNIMMASTDEMASEIPQSARDLFAEVSVFFAAMTRAISTTENPLTGEPYSIYNYTALRKIIAGSGLFVHVTQSDLTHNTSSTGVTLSKELLEGLLGLATGVGAMSFAQGMLASIGKEGLRIGLNTEDKESAVANIIFICEYLLGMPTISAMVVYANVADNRTVFELGPCIKVESGSFNLKMHKDTYLFVTPKFVREYSEDLASIASNSVFNDFVEYLRAILTDVPKITEVQDSNDQKVEPGSALVPGDSYQILGVNLGRTKTVQMMVDQEEDSVNAVTFVSSNYSSVRFSVIADVVSGDKVPIVLFDDSDQIVIKTDSFAIGATRLNIRKKTSKKKR